MSKFEYLSELEVTKATTKTYKVYQITVAGKTPELTVAPATQANTQFFNALIKRTKGVARAIQSGNITASVLEQNRDELRGLFTDYVVKAWEHVYDSEGQAVPFNKENCDEFLQALPDWIFDEITNFVSDSQNFTDDVHVDVEEAGNG